MPRYEKKGFDPEKRIQNDDLDRTVPIEENYYTGNPLVDLNFNRRATNDDVVDNQSPIDEINGLNPCQYDPFDEEPQNPLYENNTDYPAAFQSERMDDFKSPSQSPRQSPRKEDNSQARKNKHNKKEKGKKNKRRLGVGKTILLVFLALVILVVGSIFPVLGRINYDDKTQNTYVSAADLRSSKMVKNVLLLGVDARTNEEGEASRSDSMMLVSLDMKNRCIKMVSFLRDTWVYIPVRDGEQRLNAACTYGGYSGVVDTIEYNFGVKIDNYVVADFEMFQTLVDSIGGVEVEVTKKEAKEVTGHPKRYGNVTLDSGVQNLTGEQALAYCRIRKIDTDFVRAKRQRTVMNAIIKKAKSTNPFTLYKMAWNSAPFIETDMTKGELMSFVAKAGLCASGETYQDKIPFEGTWKYENIRGNSVIGIDTKKNKEMLIDFIYEKKPADLNTEE